MARPGAIERREGWRGQLARAWDSDLLASFLSQKLTIVAALVTVVLVLAALLAPLIAPHSPFDLRTISIMDANLPPAWRAGGGAQIPPRAAHQGPGILSPILYRLAG